jgi:transcriptional regulator with XRE-family HTH domain
MDIGKNIKKLRKHFGLTQVELAQRLGITQKVITDYETGKAQPPQKRLPHIARFFNITVDKLIGAQELNPPPTEQPKTPYGNTKTAHVIKLFEQLGEEEQRVILKQIRALTKQSL